jgi:hypothetical protein
MRKYIVASLGAVVACALFSGMTLAAEESAAVASLVQPMNNLGNQMGYCGSEISASLRYLGNCLLGSAAIISVALMVAGRRQQKI